MVQRRPSIFLKPVNLGNKNSAPHERVEAVRLNNLFTLWGAHTLTAELRVSGSEATALA